MFQYDGKLMQGLNYISDLIWLNLLTVLCSLPIITVGPALTAMHCVLLQIAQKKEPKIARSFFRAFRSGFGQSVALGLICLVVLIVAGTDYWCVVVLGLKIPKLMGALILCISLYCSLIMVWIFPLRAIRGNSVGNTLKDAFSLTLLHPLRSIAMLAFWCISLLLILVWQPITTVALLGGFAIPGLAGTLMYQQIFHKIECEDPS